MDTPLLPQEPEEPAKPEKPAETAAPRVAREEDEYVTGTLIAGRYRVVERIGDGATGCVYLAEHEGLRRRVALKFLHEAYTGNREVAARFAREAVAAARLEHPNVVAVYDSGADERGRCFLAMEYFDGEELRAVLRREGALPRERVIELGRQIARALDHAHGLGIVHRDIKPENVLVLRREGAEFVKVIDFGIAKVFLPNGSGDTALTRTGIVLGTPEYMAPEQALGGDIDHRADLYAFAVTVYEMLVGRRPFDEDDVMTLLMRHINAPPPKPSAALPDAGFTEAVDAVFVTALAKTSGSRHGTATEFIDALERALNAPAPSRSPAPPRATSPGERLSGALSVVDARARDVSAELAARWQEASRRARVAVIAGLLAACAGAVGYALNRREPDDGPQPLLAPDTAAPARVEPRRDLVTSDLAARIEALRARPELVSGITNETQRDRQRAALALEEMHAQSPDDAAVGYVLGSIYARDRATAPQALAAYRDALRAAPELARDDALVDDVVRIYATVPALGVPAEALLRGALADTALPRLVDACLRGAPGGGRVAELLGSAPFDDRMDATQRALVAMTAARTCAAKREAVDALARDGDARALPPLRRISTGSGCGILGLETCNPCLRTALPLAIRAIEARTGDGG